MAPKKRSPKKDAKTSPTAKASPPKKRGRPTKAATKAKQTAAEERAEQEIAAESTTCTTRSGDSPVKATSAKKPAPKVAKTQKRSVRKAKKPVGKSPKAPKEKGNVEYADGEDEESIEVADPIPQKQKKGAASGSKKISHPLTEVSDLSPARNMPKKPNGLSAATKKLLASIEKDTYEAVPYGGIQAKTFVADSAYPCVSKHDFEFRSNAGAVRAMEEMSRNPKAITSASKTPRPTTPPAKKTTQIAKTPEPTHADAHKLANEEREQLLVERRRVLANLEPYATTLDSETQVANIPKLSKRGDMISSTNPGIISIVIDKTKPQEKQERVNPFFETLPGSEVWHRNMPPFFSFGETKFMQQYISDEINQDLARTHPNITTAVTTTAPASLSRTGGFLGKATSPIRNSVNYFLGNTTQPEPQPADRGPDIMKTLRPDQWTLPKLTQQDKADIRREIQRKYPGYKPPATPASPRKRSAQGPAPSAKRPRAPHHHP